MASQKIAVYSLPDLKNTTDDALPNYLTSLKFKQSHHLTDVRLALGYAAVIIAAITFVADYKLGWDKTKAGTLWAVLMYFALNGALTVWIWAVEKGQVFTGEVNHPSKGPSVLSIASSVTKHTPVYTLTVKYTDIEQKDSTLVISSPFTRWFDVNGFFVAKPFQQWLASEIPIVGQVVSQNKAGNVDVSIKTNGGPESTEPAKRQKLETSKRSGSSDSAPANAKSRKERK